MIVPLVIESEKSLADRALRYKEGQFLAIEVGYVTFQVDIAHAAQRCAIDGAEEGQ